MPRFSCLRTARFFSALTYTILVVWGCGLPGVAASEPLAWRLTAGETHHYRMSQTMAMTLEAGAGAKQTSNLDQGIYMSWNILGVDAAQLATVVQKVDRMTMKLRASTGQSIDYDSLSDKAPQGMAAMIAPMIKQLTKTSFEVKMSPRGEIVEVNVPDDLIEALKASPGSAMLGEMLSKDGFKQMIEKGSLVLPETLEKGGKWSSQVELKNPMFGSQTVRTTYEYLGPRVVEGENMEVFSPAIEMTFGQANGPAAPKISISKQDSSGEILFNRDAGRLESSKIVMNMTMNISVQGQDVTQDIQQTIELQHLAEDEWKQTNQLDQPEAAPQPAAAKK